MTSITISNALLWVLMLGVIVALWALARQVGILYERVAPMGALITDAGPKLGEVSPQFDLPSLSGATVAICDIEAFSIPCWAKTRASNRRSWAADHSILRATAEANSFSAWFVSPSMRAVRNSTSLSS